MKDPKAAPSGIKNLRGRVGTESISRERKPLLPSGKHRGIEELKNGKIRCQACRRTWIPSRLPNGGLKRDWWGCPAGCNRPIKTRSAHPAGSPEPQEVYRVRRMLGLSQKEAAGIIGITLASWQKYEQGTRNMHSSKWRLFLLETSNPKNRGNRG